MRNLKPCVRCGKKFNQMSSLKYHLFTKQKPCEAKFINLSGEEIMEDYYKYLDIYNKTLKPKPTLKPKHPKKRKLSLKNPKKPPINNLIKNLGKKINNNNDIGNNDIEHNDIGHNDIGHNDENINVYQKIESKTLPKNFSHIIKQLMRTLQVQKIEYLMDNNVDDVDNINYNDIEIDYDNNEQNKSKITYKSDEKSKYTLAKLTIRFK